jgi:hypothetical protein
VGDLAQYSISYEKRRLLTLLEKFKFKAGKITCHTTLKVTDKPVTPVISCMILHTLFLFTLFLKYWEGLGVHQYESFIET